MPLLVNAGAGAQEGISADGAVVQRADRNIIEPLAPGVWRITGDNVAVSAENQGAIVNTGIISTGEGVIVIDPGPNQRRAVVINELIRTVTKEPVRWIIDTHPHPENVLGNSGFPQAQIIASEATAEQMRGRCSLCLQRLVDQLGTSTMQGTVIRLPSTFVADGQTLLLGQRRLRFLVFAHAHSHGDTAVVLPEAGIVFAGGLLNDRRVPDLREAALDGWITALDVLQGLAMPLIVPGHGKATDSMAIGRFASYLTDLKTACDSDIARHGDAASSADRLDLAHYADWAEYSQQHRLNVARIYQEREDAQLLGDK